MAGERSVDELLDELFGFESVAKRQTALEQYDCGELVRKARSRELLGVLRGVEAAEHAARDSAVRAVDGYVRRVEGAALARARKQAGIVGPLRMERRYAAFLRMEDKAELLARLEQTLAFIEVKLRANTAARVRTAYDAAGALVLQGVARLSDVRVADAVPLDADLLCTQLEQLRCAADATDLAGMITATFESELSATGSQGADGFTGDVAGDVALERELTNVRGAAQRARLAAQAYRAERAARVAGSAPPALRGARWSLRGCRSLRALRARRRAMSVCFPSCSLRLRSRLRPTVVLLPTAGCSVRLARAPRTAFVVARVFWTTILGLMRMCWWASTMVQPGILFGVRLRFPSLWMRLRPRVAIRSRLPWRACASLTGVATTVCWMRILRAM